MTQITFASPDDLPDILTMIRALSAFHNDEAKVTLDQLRDIFFGSAAMGHTMGTALIAKEDDVAVGYAGLTPVMVLHDAEIRLDIHHLFIAESHRQKGIGKALIAAAKDHAQQIGATRLTIGTDAGNATAISAYRAMDILEEISGSGPRFRVDLSKP